MELMFSLMYEFDQKVAWCKNCCNKVIINSLVFSDWLYEKRAQKMSSQMIFINLSKNLNCFVLMKKR